MSLRTLTTLVRKEIRQLAPLAVALGSMLLLGAVYALCFEAADEQLWAAYSPLMSDDMTSMTLVVGVMVGLITAYNLLPGEHEKRTIEFLYSLPVARATVFRVKVATAAMLLVVFVALAWASNLVYLTNPDSVENGRPPGRIFALDLLLATAFYLYALAYGVLLSFFRRLMWLLVALVVGMLKALEGMAPSLRILNPAALYDIEHHGTTPLVPWRVWVLHFALSALALIAAERLWLRQDEGGLATRLARARLRPRLRRVASAVALLVVTAAAGMLMNGRDAPATDDADKSDGQETRVITTPQFHFTYFPGSETQARFVAREADAVYARVRSRLGGPEIDTIIADLTEESRDHAGIAGWKRLRMDVRSRDEGELRHVLHHELTHVVSLALAEGWSQARHAEASAFLEGLAEHVSYDLTGDEARRRESRAIAAAAKTRYRVRFEELLSRSSFVARYSEDLLYALGEVWVAALVDVCGASAPGRILERWGGDGVPQALSGVALWRHTLQGLRCDLDRALSRFDQRLAAHAADGEALPHAEARLLAGTEESLRFEVEVRARTPGHHDLLLVLRDGPETSPRDMVTATFDVEGGTRRQIALSRPRVLGGQRFEYQVGAAASRGGRPLFTPWRSAPLPR